MPSPRHVIVPETRQSRITILDLSTHEFSHVEHLFARDESDLIDLETFYDSRLLCVQESGHYNDNRFILTYYPLPLNPDSKPLARYESQDNEWTY